MNTTFLKTALVLTSFSVLFSCDKDFNTIGADIVGADHFGMTKYDDATMPLLVDITPINTGAIQSNNLDINLFGIFSNPTFGTTTANFVTQVQLASVAPTIDPLLIQTIESVTLYVPYAVKSRTANTTSGSYTYTIDNIVDQSKLANNEMKLSVFENGFDLISPDVNQVTPGTKLFSDQNAAFDLFKVGTRLNQDGTNIPLAHNDKFSFSEAEYSDISTTPTTYIAPGIRINLNKDRFKQLLFVPTSGSVTENLKNNANFTKYFKGLYFKIEENSSTTNCQNMIDFKKGTITVKYKEFVSVPIIDQALPSQVEKSIILNFTGNCVSLLSNPTPTPSYSDRIVLKGGESAVAEIKLFGSPNALGQFPVIKKMRDEKYLINEANLVFYVDKSKMTSVEPNRIFLYDMRNKRPIIDYYFDSSTSTIFNGGKLIFGGVKEEVSSSITKYKLRLTNHIRNIVSKDSTNTSLGLSVCYNVNNQAFYKAKNAPILGSAAWDALAPHEKNAFYYPVSSIMNPYGIILFGSNLTTADLNYNNRAQLEIWYTKPE